MASSPHRRRSAKEFWSVLDKSKAVADPPATIAEIRRAIGQTSPSW